MNNEEQYGDQIERLFNLAWRSGETEGLLTLKTKYEEKLKELDISSFQAEKNLGIDYKTLNRLLDGNLKKFDLIPLMKLGYFLGIPEKEIQGIFISYLSGENKIELEEAKRTTFILSNFDLQVLKELGIINSLNDFKHIENRINEIFGLKSILDYNTDDVGAAMSSTNIKPKNEKSRKYFKSKSRAIFKLIDNPHRFDKEALIEYFSKIRWHTTDFDNGMVNVIRSLYSLGVTVIFQPKMPFMQMRGATFEVNGKPCIVLTDFRKSYPTMWWALLHELFHVLFDWDEILLKRYHLSDEENDLTILKHKEDEANDFAREYLLPKQKLEIIIPKIKQAFFVKEFAIDNDVHYSIIYAHYAFLYKTDENNLWAQFEKSIRPPMDVLLQKLSGGLSHETSTKEFAQYYINKIFNKNNNTNE